MENVKYNSEVKTRLGSVIQPNGNVINIIIDKNTYETRHSVGFVLENLEDKIYKSNPKLKWYYQLEGNIFNLTDNYLNLRRNTKAQEDYIWLILKRTAITIQIHFKFKPAVLDIFNKDKESFNKIFNVDNDIMNEVFKKDGYYTNMRRINSIQRNHAGEQRHYFSFKLYNIEAIDCLIEILKKTRLMDK